MTMETATGLLEVLSVGDGDVKITIDVRDPESEKKAGTMIEDMLYRGYAIYLETAKLDKEGRPVLRRLKRFDPKRLEYTLQSIPGDEAPPKPVSVGKVRATAIGRTAGG